MGIFNKILGGRQPTRVKLDGFLVEIALSKGGYLYALAQQEGSAQLTCLDLAGRRIGNNYLPGPANWPFQKSYRQMRVAEDGTAWLGFGKLLCQVDASGRTLSSLELHTEPEEELASFLMLRDGFIVSFFYPPPFKVRDPRIIRLDNAGKVRWSTLLPPPTLAYSGVVQMRADEGWKSRPVDPWRAGDWQPSRRGAPLLLSGGLLLAGYFELRSGIGCSFCLDAATGKHLWTTDRRPEASTAIAGPEEFFVGSQGYGAFDFYLYGRSGTVLRHWPAYGHIVIAESGEVRAVEMENVLPSKMHFSIA